MIENAWCCTVSSIETPYAVNLQKRINRRKAFLLTLQTHYHADSCELCQSTANFVIELTCKTEHLVISFQLFSTTCQFCFELILNSVIWNQVSHI